MTNFDRNSYAYGTGVAQAGAAEFDQGLRAFMLGVYNNMILGLAISGLVALGTNMLAVAGDPASAVARMGSINLTAFGVAIYGSPLKWVVMLAPLAFIFFFSFRMERMTAATARSVFYLFAAVMGLSMSSILLVFTSASVVQTFFVTAAAFGALSLFGYTTKRSLSGFGSFLIMGLVGLMLASLVNIGLVAFGYKFQMLQLAISAIGVLIFAGLTAYDTQRLKEMYVYGGGDSEGVAKLSIMGALSLYLNFINMFQFLLSLVGQRNE